MINFLKMYNPLISISFIECLFNCQMLLLTEGEGVKILVYGNN